MAEAAQNPFDTLPIETNQHIASYLDNELDLCRYRRICHSTHDAVDADRCSFWRRRFLTTFEKPNWPGGSNERYKITYQKRKRALMFGAKFKVAISNTGKDVGKQITKGIQALEVLRDLIVDSFSDKREGMDDAAYESLNMDHILRFIVNQDLLEVVFLPDRRSSKDVHCLPKQLLQTIQVMLAPAMLSLEYRHLLSSHFGYPQSQYTAYGTATEHPIFGGCNNLDINMEWVLHHLNFWKYHMVRRDEQTLYNAFKDLDDDETPRFWNQRLKTGGNKLGTYWKGCYAYVEREVILDIRAGLGQDGMIQDEFNGEADEGSFQDLRLQFVDGGEDAWPWQFEQHLHSLTAPVSRAKTRAQHRSATPEGIAGFKPQNFQFGGEGHDATEDFCAQGWLNALPPQQGIPGWQRMTMMKYFRDPDTNAIDDDALWAYEGVVLPGGQIMLGRWWSPGDGTGNSMYSGPFILWCVDGPKNADFDADVDDDVL
ncbi:hypothetical protein LTR36_005306 [Oleoguttula mirabilis]|uniref:F-box domain-containing protein n=1 Tax=Oleoguttula mirabilis TaxID=1507867 RepID=A0AAV9JEX0_9PEZI|nr:hypothetical protein LTR36_005306 [Oleoguttula mirabilis]